MLENVRPYLISLIIDRKRPPILNGHIDWTAIGETCGIENEMTAELKKQLRLALDAIIRWLKAPPVAEDDPPAVLSTRTSKAEAVKKCSASFLDLKAATRYGRRSFCREHICATRSCAKANQPIPDPLLKATDDPASFQNAVIYHMRRIGDSY